MSILGLCNRENRPKYLHKGFQYGVLVARTSLESTVKLLLIVELDRAEQERKITVQRIKDGIEASSKRSGRATGKLDKMSDELEADIQFFIKDLAG